MRGWGYMNKIVIVLISYIFFLVLIVKSSYLRILKFFKYSNKLDKEMSNTFKGW